VTECIDCISGTIDEEGMCYISGCHELKLDGISTTKYVEPAICDECMIGFGLFNNECIECKNENQFWNHCADCEISPSSK